MSALKSLYLALGLCALLPSQARSEEALGGMITPLSIALEYTHHNAEHSGVDLRLMAESYVIAGYGAALLGYRIGIARGFFIIPSIGYGEYSDISDRENKGGSAALAIGYDWFWESGMYMGVEAGMIAVADETLPQLPKFRIGYRF